MPFDILSLDTATGADRGAEMELTDPRTGQPARDENDLPITITLLGRNSERARECGTRQVRRRLESAKRGKRGISPEDLEAEMVDLLTACTMGWSFTEIGGQPFPFSEANARKLWSDPRFRALREAADQFIGDDANFLQRDDR